MQPDAQRLFRLGREPADAHRYNGQESFIAREGGELRVEGNGDDVVGCFWAPLEALEESGLTTSDLEAVRAIRARGLLPRR